MNDPSAMQMGSPFLGADTRFCSLDVKTVSTSIVHVLRIPKQSRAG